MNDRVNINVHTVVTVIIPNGRVDSTSRNMTNLVDQSGKQAEAVDENAYRPSPTKGVMLVTNPTNHIRATRSQMTQNFITFLCTSGFTMNRNRSNDIAASVWTDTEVLCANTNPTNIHVPFFCCAVAPNTHLSATRVMNNVGMNRTDMRRFASARLNSNIADDCLRLLAFIRAWMMMMALAIVDRIMSTPTATASRGVTRPGITVKL